MRKDKGQRQKTRVLPSKPISSHSYDSKLFRWSFKSYCHEHDCWKMESVSVITEIIWKLEDYSTQTWHEVKSASGGKSNGNGTNNHFIAASKLPNDLQRVYIQLGYMRNYDNVFSLRLTGKRRLIGYVQQGVFFVLWYDPDHRIFPMNI